MSTEKKQTIKSFLLKLITLFTAVLPFSFSSAMFIGFKHYIFIIIAVILLMFSVKASDKKIMPMYAGFLVTMFFSKSLGITAAVVALILFGIITVVYLFLPERKSDSPIASAFSLATALTVTVLLTTHYFGIGASGANVREMISSYLSLGFHPNWRGVLYGTIVMVIMITFPRKFKKFCSVVKAPFIAIGVTLILNLFLNPPDMKTAITEIGNFSDAIFPDVINRIPVHSLAVVMIVGAWESVEWKKVKNAFSSVHSVVFFIISIVSTLYFGYVYGILISAVLYIIYSIIFRKSKTHESQIA